MGAQPAARILVVDDEKACTDALCLRLQHEGYSAVACYDGGDALNLIRQDAGFDLLILDLMMPGQSGWDICAELKRDHFESPILLLSASSEESDRVTGLDMGADDYVTKPFSFPELLARVRVLLRRREPAQREVGPFVFDFTRRVVLKGTQDLALSPKEFSIVCLLLRRSPQVVKREEILRQVWGPQFIGDQKTVAIHMRWIRQKLEERPDQPAYVCTARGGGYYFQLPGGA